MLSSPISCKYKHIHTCKTIPQYSSRFACILLFTICFYSSESSSSSKASLSPSSESEEDERKHKWSMNKVTKQRFDIFFLKSYLDGHHCHQDLPKETNLNPVQMSTSCFSDFLPLILVHQLEFDHFFRLLFLLSVLICSPQQTFSHTYKYINK